MGKDPRSGLRATLRELVELRVRFVAAGTVVPGLERRIAAVKAALREA